MSTVASQTRTVAAPARRWARALPRWLIILPLAVSLTATVLAMHRTSATFDEIVLIAGGARGFRTGDFGLAPDHPPVMQYLYGLPAYLSHPHYPREVPGRWNPRTRYNYARAFFWENGNDPEVFAFRSRLVAAALALLLVLVVWGFTLRAFGPAPALLAGTLTAFLPDVLAHGGVAYNDIPTALTFLATLWAVDAAARRPTVGRGALTGLLAALAIGVKYSAILLAPAAFLVVAAELLARWSGRAGLAARFGAGESAAANAAAGAEPKLDARWAIGLGIALAASLVVMYLALVAIFRGDFALSALRYGIRSAVVRVDTTVGAPNFLLGQRRVMGWWYYFPVAFLYKTSAALHLLMLAAVVGFFGAVAPDGWRVRARLLLASRLRVPVLGGLVFGGALLRSHLDIGFRYALPLLPLLCIITAVGVVRLWRRARPLVRYGLALLVAWYIASPLAAYPWFLSYMSEYGPGRDSAYEVLADSSLDWGQGLLALRDFMRREKIPSVYLSYFGSAPPEGYGINYVPLPSFFPLARKRAPGPAPKWIVVSGTNLESVYFATDGFATLRRARPDRVLGGSLYVYRLHD